MKTQPVMIRFVVALVICLLLSASSTSICAAQQDNQRLDYFKERLEAAIWDRDHYINDTEAEYKNLLNTVSQIAAEKEGLALEEHAEFISALEQQLDSDYDRETDPRNRNNISRPGYRAQVTEKSLAFYEYIKEKEERGEDLTSADRFMRAMMISSRRWPDAPEPVDLSSGLVTWENYPFFQVAGLTEMETPHTETTEKFRQHYHSLSPEDRERLWVAGMMYRTYARMGLDMRSDEQREKDQQQVEIIPLEEPCFDSLLAGHLETDPQYQALRNRIASIESTRNKNQRRVEELQDLVNQYEYVENTSDVDYSDMPEYKREVEKKREQEGHDTAEGSNDFISNAINDISDWISRVAQGGFGQAEPVAEPTLDDSFIVREGEMPGEWFFPRPYGDIYDSGHSILDDLGDEYVKQPDGSWVATGENFGPLPEKYWPDSVPGQDYEVAVTIDGEREVVYNLEEGDQSADHTFSALATEPGEYAYAWSFGDGRDYTENPGEGRRSGGLIRYENITEDKTLALSVRLYNAEGEFLGSDQVRIILVFDEEELDDIDVRQDEMVECGIWYRSGSGGAGTTRTVYDISELPVGTSFDMKFNAQGIPDKFIVEYEGAVVYDSGWRGSRINDPNLYPGGLSGPGQGEARAMFVKNNSDSFTVTVIGPERGTAWSYELMANCPPGMDIEEQ